LKITAILLGITVLGVLSCTALGQENPSLTVMGEGSVTVPADMVTIGVSVESSNQNLTLASEEAQEALDRTIEALLAVGVKREEIFSGDSSSVFRLQDQSSVCRTVNNTTVCENSSYDIKKLEKSALLRLKTTDETRINEILRAARSAGAEAEIIGYGLSDVSSAAEQARKKAAEDARSNAQGMALAAGGRLGKVLDISAYAYPDVNMASPFGSRSNDPKMVDVTAYVMATYEIIMP
jgi:uncharacterized protein YggE